MGYWRLAQSVNSVTNPLNWLKPHCIFVVFACLRFVLWVGEEGGQTFSRGLNNVKLIQVFKILSKPDWNRWKGSLKSTREDSLKSLFNSKTKIYWDLFRLIKTQFYFSVSHYRNRSTQVLDWQQHKQQQLARKRVLCSLWNCYFYREACVTYHKWMFRNESAATTNLCFEINGWR